MFNFVLFFISNISSLVISDEVEIFGPNIKPFSFKMPDIYNEDGEKVNIGRHPEEILKFKLDKKVYPNDMIRIKIS